MIVSIHNPNPNPNGLSGIAALMLDYNDNIAIDITAKSHYSYYQLTTHNSSVAIKYSSFVYRCVSSFVN